MSTGNNWRIMINHNNDSFMRDEINLTIAWRGQDGYQFVVPFEIRLSDVVRIPGLAEEQLQPTTAIPRQLAELLLNELGHQLVGKGDMVTEIQRLRYELARANKRVDDLIMGFAGIGKQAMDKHSGPVVPTYLDPQPVEKLSPRTEG